MNNTRRRGAILVAVLVCLMVVILLAGSLVQAIISRHRQLRIQEHQAQAQWLAESAVERGAARLRAAADYQGETWQAAAEELDADRSGVATIRVEMIEGLPQRRRLVVEAAYPDDPHRRVAAIRQVLVDLPNTEKP